MLAVEFADRLFVQLLIFGRACRVLGRDVHRGNRLLRIGIRIAWRRGVDDRSLREANERRENERAYCVGCSVSTIPSPFSNCIAAIHRPIHPVFAFASQPSVLAKHPTIYARYVRTSVITRPATSVRSLVAAVVVEGKFLVVQPQQVQNRGVQVVDVDFVLFGTQAQRIGRAVSHSAADAAAGQPHRVSPGIMVAAASPFAHRHAAKLAAPNHQRIVP